MRYLPLVFAVLLGCLSPGAGAQSPRTEHTFGLDDPAQRPAATLADAALLIGAWKGEAFGQSFEAVWNPPSGGSMVGFFKLLDGDKVVFYEILLLVEEEGSLGMKVKHFHPDFTAWEEKSDYVHFKFVRAEPDAVHFSGLSFYRRDADHLDGYIVMRSKDTIREEKLTYRRVSLGSTHKE
ncbi:MAG: DUF6265 family protein [Pseudomonadota bacterium]